MRSVGAAVLSVATVLFVAPPGAGAVTCDGSFHPEDTHITLNDAPLYGFGGTAQGDAWAVGGSAEPNGVHTLARHWDGTTWNTSTPVDVNPAFTWFAGVAGDLSDDVWAVGQTQGPHGALHGLVERWDGEQWTVSDQTKGSDVLLQDVAVVDPTNIYAVGTGKLNETGTPTGADRASRTSGATRAAAVRSVLLAAARRGEKPSGLAVVRAGSASTTGTTPVALIRHFDGELWTTLRNPGMHRRNAELNAVDASSYSDIWAVGTLGLHAEAPGSDESPGGRRTLIEHSDGGPWTITPSPSPGAFRNALFGVDAIDPGDVWAVGWSEGAAGYRRPLVLHYDGDLWNVVDAPGVPNRPNELYSVTAVSSTDVWAFGVWRDRDQAFHKLVMHYDGEGWSVVHAPYPGGSETVAVDSGLAGSDLWWVGSKETSPGGDIQGISARRC
jgi:hypothetical protein